jgi:hypothetical protein
VQKCRSAEVQKCRSAEVQNYSHATYPFGVSTRYDLHTNISVTLAIFSQRLVVLVHTASSTSTCSDLNPHLLILLCRSSATHNVHNVTVTPRREEHNTTPHHAPPEPLTDMLHDGVVPRESVSAEGVVVVRRNGEDREGHDWGVSGTRRRARRARRGRRRRRAQLGRFQRSTADNRLLAFSTAPTFECPKTRVLQHSTASTSDCSYTRHLSPKSQSVQPP